MRPIGTLILLSTVAVVTFGATLAVMLPSTEDALDHSEKVAQPSDSYIWYCSVFTDDSDIPVAHERTVSTITIPREAYKASILSDAVRQGTVFYPSPSGFVDPGDIYIRDMSDHISEKINQIEDYYGHEYNDYQRALCILDFVRSLDYLNDDILYGQNEFWAKPLEMLYNHAGDCEDASVLFCSIARVMGFDTVLLDYDGHMAAGIFLEGKHDGMAYALDSGTCYYCECTSLGFGNSVSLDSYAARSVSERVDIRYDKGSLAGDFLNGYRGLMQRILKI